VNELYGSDLQKCVYDLQNQLNDGHHDCSMHIMR